MDYPSLHLGLFSTLSASQRSALAAQLRQVVDAGFRWSLSEDLEADAVFIDPSLCAISRGQHSPTSPSQALQLHIQLGMGSFASILLERWHTPTLIALPAQHLQDLQGQEQFFWINTDTPHNQSLLDALHQITVRMRYERILYALGQGMQEQQSAVLAERGHSSAKVWQVLDEEQLMAILDPAMMDLYFNPHADPTRMRHWQWHKRPAGAASSLPARFVHCSGDEALWEFAMRSPDVALEPEFERGTLRLLRRPNVRPSLLRQRHTRLFTMLSQAQSTMGDLRSSQAPHLLRDLYALSLCACLQAPKTESPSVWGSLLDTVLPRKPEGRSFSSSGLGSLFSSRPPVSDSSFSESAF
jgi:hypothetical protein